MIQHSAEFGVRLLLSKIQWWVWYNIECYVTNVILKVISLSGNIVLYWILGLFRARYITLKITYVMLFWRLYWRLYYINITFNITYNITLYWRLYYIAGAFTAYLAPVTLSCGHSQLPFNITFNIMLCYMLYWRLYWYNITFNITFRIT